MYEEKDEIVSTYTHHGLYTYTVPVTKANPLYPVGTTLKMGMPAYFFVVSPMINMSFTYRLEATDSADINGKLETMIVATGKVGSSTEKTGTEESNVDEKTFWQKEFPLQPVDNVETWNGASVTKNYSINVSEIQLMVEDVQKQLNYSRDAKIEIVNRVNYVGKIDGEKVQGTKDFAIPLVISSSYYQLPEKLDLKQETNETKKVIIKSNPPLSTIIIPLPLFLLSLVLIGTTFICTRIGKVDLTYIDNLEKERKSSHFKEFISRGKLPEDENPLIKIEISSLQELIDAAVDMNSRVIYDVKAKTYFMVNSGVMYFFFEIL